MLVRASTCQFKSQLILICALIFFSILIFFKSHKGAIFFIEEVTISSKETSFFIKWTVLESNFDNFRRFKARKLIFRSSLLISLIKSSLVFLSISGLSMILSKMIKTEVIGVFN